MSICPITKSITDTLTNKWNTKNEINTDIIKAYNFRISQGVTANEAFTTAAQGANQATLDLISSAKDGAVSTEALNNAVKRSTMVSEAGQAALKGLASAGSMVALWAVDKGIEMAVTALSNYIHRVEIAKAKIEEINASIDNVNQNQRSRTALLEEAKASYSALAEGVNLADNTNLSLSDEDYASFLALNNELAETFPQLLAGLDEQGNAILNLGTSAKSSTDEIQALIEQEKELSNFQIAQSVPKLFSNVKTALTDSIQERDKLQAQLSSSQNNFSSLSNFASGNFTADDKENPFQLEFEYPDSDKIGIELTNIMSRAVQTFLNSSDLPSEELRAKLFTMDFSSSDDENGTPLYHTLLDASSLTEEQRNELFRIIQEEAGDFMGKATDILGDTKKQLALTSTQTDNMWTDFLPNLLLLTRSKPTYENLDTDLQKMTEQVIASLDYSTMITDMDTGDPYDYVLDHIITPLQNLSEEQKLQVSKLFSGELSQEDANALRAQLQDTFQETGIEIPLDVIPVFKEQATPKQQFVISEALAQAQEKALLALGMSYEDYAAIKQKAADAGTDLFQALDKEIDALAMEGLLSQEAASALFYYQLQKALANENGISTAEDCSNLLALAENAGITGNIIEDLIRLEQIYQEVSKGTIPITKVETLLAEANSLTASIEAQAANFKTAENSAEQYAARTGALAGAQRSAASAADRYTSALEEQKSALESQKSVLEEQKQHYEDVIQAVNWFYDKQIGKVQTLIDGLQKENKLLEKRKGNYDMALSSIDRFYDREIQKTKERQDAVQEKIDALKAENEERRKSYELEKAAYELEKARNQRTDQVYVQGKGMVYVSNDNAVQEAENTYENLLEDQRVSDLEKQKADLDLTIAKLEEYRQLWSEVSSSYQFAQEDMMLSQLLGATWETDLLNGRMETLSLFRDTYNGIQAEINSNEQLIASYEEKIEYYQGLKEQWEELTGKYQEETYIQLLTTEFGNNYENELLNGRTGRWTKFSEEYASIQKQLKEVTDQIEALAARMESYASRMESAASRAKAAANTINGISVIPAGGNLPRYRNVPIGGGRAKGGIISPKDSNALDGLARSVGEDHLVPLQEGEAVIPKTVVRENAPIVQMLLAGKLTELKMPHSERGILDHPEFRKPPAVSSPLPSPSTEILNLTAPADRTTLQFYGDLSFPNIHSGDDAKKLIEELSHLSGRGRQYFNRQH